MIQRGFTLIELLVVLVIAGIIAGLTVIAVRGGSWEDQAEEALRRIAALTDLAAQQAVLEGREYGLEMLRDGYRFVRYAQGRWTLIENDELLRTRALAAGLRPDLRVDGAAVRLGAEGGEPRPQVLLYSSGERTPFRLTLAPEGERPGWLLAGGLFDAARVTPSEAW